MIELAELYLGNIRENAHLAERLETGRQTGFFLEVYISQTESRKGRIHAHTTCGVAVGIVKSREWLLKEGDVFETAQGRLLLIHLQDEKVMVLSFTKPVPDCAIDLVHLGHVIGNHHWSIIVQEQKIYVQLVADREVMEATIRNFSIPGLQITYEWQSPEWHIEKHLEFSQHTHNHL